MHLWSIFSEFVYIRPAGQLACQLPSHPFQSTCQIWKQFNKNSLELSKAWWHVCGHTHGRCSSVRITKPQQYLLIPHQVHVHSYGYIAILCYISSCYLARFCKLVLKIFNKFFHQISAHGLWVYISRSYTFFKSWEVLIPCSWS